MKVVLLSLALLVAAPAAYAETCGTANLPAGWEAWNTPGSITAAAKAAEQPEISLGKAYAAQLQPAADTLYEVEPRKGVTAGTFGGLFMLTIDTAGDYTVALDGKAWIDVIRDGQVVESTSHQEGPACSGIHKMVVFALTPGHYTLQLANAPVQTVRVEVK